MTRVILYVVIAILFVSNVILILNSRKNNEITNRVNATAANINTNYHELSDNLFQQYDLEGFTVAEAIKAVDGSEISIKNLIDESPGEKFVFRFQETSCNPCIHSQLKLIGELSKKVSPDRIIILATYDAYNKLRVMLTTYNIKAVKAFAIKPNEKLIPFDKDFVQPYAFLINRDMKMKNVFFPVKNDEHLSKRYYQLIAQRMLINAK